MKEGEGLQWGEEGEWGLVLGQELGVKEGGGCTEGPVSRQGCMAEGK